MDSYYKSNKFKEVLKRYEDFLENDDLGMLTTEDFADVAQYYHEQHDDPKALEAVDKSLEVFPGSVAPLAFKSRYALLEEQDAAKADSIAELIDDKNDPDYYLLKAEIMIVDGRVEEADDYLENAYHDFYDDDYYDDMPLDVASLFIDYEATDYADKWLQRSDETDEDDYLDVKARILIANNKLEEGKKIVDDLLYRDPYSTEYWNLLAASNLFGENFSDAITASDYALAIDPLNGDAILNKANGMLGLENADQATSLFKRYTQLEPHADTGYLMVGLTLLGQDRYQEAKTWLEKALKVNTSSKRPQWQNRTEILFQLAFIENYLCHYAKAHEYLDGLADVYKDKFSSDLNEMGQKLADVDCAQGHICLEEEDLEKAADWFEQAVSDSNNSPKIFIRIAVSAFEFGYVQYSYEILHQVVYQENFDDEKGLQCLSSCCKILKKDDERRWAEDKLDKIFSSKDN